MGEKRMDGHLLQKEQSRQRLESALFALLKDKEFDEITISELSKKADVARRTFYRLYCTKEEIIEIYFQKLCREYMGGNSKISCYDIQQIAKEFFGFWYLKKEILLLLHKRGLDRIIYNEINHAAVNVISDRLPEELRKQREDIEFFALYSVGGFCNLLMSWVENGIKESPEVFSEKAGKAITKYLKKDIYV